MTVNLELLLDCGESDWLDWKADFATALVAGPKHEDWNEEKAKVLKDLIALANGEGEPRAFLAYGVKDHVTKREVRGISKRWDDALFQQWAELAFDPPPRFTYSEVEADPGKPVGVFDIERVPGYPHVARVNLGGVLHEGQVWFRRGSKNTVALRDELVRMIRGAQPMKFSTLWDPEFKKLQASLAENGRVVCLPLLSEKDSKLLQGYEIAYFPGTRREIWAGENGGLYGHVVMLKPAVPQGGITK